MDPKQFDPKQLYDVVVIGGGPAGLTAGLYLARAKYRVLIVEKAAFGGQITITDQVVNYPGVLHTSGKELTETMRQQAQSFGAEFLLAEVTGLSLDDTVKTVKTDRGDLSCFGVLWATGAHPRMVGFPGEEAFRGRGVAYCATCDGEFFTGRDVFVVGGGFAAAEEAVFLTKYARHVTILIRGKDFSCAPTAADAARKHPKITVLTHTQVQAVEGDSALRLLRYQNTETGQVTEYQPPEGETFGLFVFAGYQPATELLQGLAKLDPQGYVLTDKSQQTSVPGLYAAGDVCHRRGRRRSGRHGAGKIRCRLPAGRGPAPRCSSVYPRIGHPRRAALRTRRAKRFRQSLPPGDAGPAPHRLRPHGFPPGAGADPEQRPRLPGAGRLHGGSVCPHRQAHSDQNRHRSRRPLRPHLPGRRELDGTVLPRRPRRA